MPLPDDLPEWLTPDVQALPKRLGVDDWHIEITMTDKPGGAKSKEGEARTRARYLTAFLEINSGMDDEGLRNTLLHEHLHVAFAQMDRTVDLIIAMLPKKLRKHAEELYTDANEQTVMRLVTGLLPLLLPEKNAE